MPKVDEGHRTQRRDQILDAALARFAERGFQSTSMADIFDASGLSAGAVYSYFKSKQELAIAVARRAVGAQIAGMSADLDAGQVPSPAGLLRAITDGIRRQGVPTPLILQLWGEAGSDPEFRAITTEVFAALGAGFRAYLERWALQSGRADAADAAAWAEDALPVMLALGQGYIVQSAIADGFDADRYFAGVTRILG